MPGSSVSSSAGTSAKASAWLIHYGAAGFVVQCEGLAEALGLEATTHIVRPPFPHRMLAPWGPAASDARFNAPFPHIAIGTSRQAVPYMRQLARQGVFTVFLQNPKVKSDNFDLVWAPSHDKLAGENVVSTIVSPHGLTQEKLDAATSSFAEQIGSLPTPRLGVVIGGNNGVFSIGKKEIEQLAAQLRLLVEQHGIGLIVTPSRRTGAENIACLREALKDLPAFVWDFTGENPYHALLAHSDWLLVTCDSVNMVGEAAFTGKPVYMLKLPGGSTKFARFHQNMISAKAARWFDGTLDNWSSLPLNATTEIAEAVARAYLAKTGKALPGKWTK